MSKTFLFVTLIAVSACSGPARTGETAAETPQCDSARVVAKLPRELAEVSGIASSIRNPGTFWVHNDDSPILYAIDTTGVIRARVGVQHAKNRDWEDIAVAPCGSESCLFIGDIGDNSQDAARRTIYRFSEPSLQDTTTSSPVEYWFTMPDKSHDTEALAVLPDGRMFVVTKGRSGPITIFAFPQPLIENEAMMLKPVGTLSEGLVQLPEMVTGGSGFSNGIVAFRTYGGLQFYRVHGDSLTAVYEMPYDLQGLQEPQGEGITVRNDGAVFLTSEKSMGESALFSRAQCTVPD